MSVRPPGGTLPTALLFLPACFVVEVILAGPAGVRVGGYSLRLPLLAVSSGVLCFGLLVRGRVDRAQLVPILSVVGFLLLNGVWVAIVPVLTGTDMHWTLREAYSFVTLLPVALAIGVLDTAQLAGAVSRLQRIVVLTSLVLAGFQVSLWVVGTLFGEQGWLVPLVLGMIYPGGTDQLFVGPIGDGFFRVFWISTLWCVLAFFWAPVVLPPGPIRWLGRGLLVLDLFVAYSRGIWIGLLAGLGVVFAVTWSGRNPGRRLVRSAAAAALAAGILLAVLDATGTLEQGVARFQSTTSREDLSISSRIEQAPFLLQLWYEHPAVGSGYGAYVPGYLRSQETPYSYEHMPYALLAKLGLVGVLVSGTFLFGWGLTAWDARRRAPAQAGAFLGACVALLVAEMTNPMVLNFVSMSIFACLLLQWAHLVTPAADGERWGHEPS
jgi:hypothetical protein